MPRRRLIAAIGSPAQLVVGAFVAFIAIGTGLLWLPISADGPGHVGLEDALFTSTSAATVTGLMSTDISRFSLFGELVILLLIQIGGFGIMTIGSVLAIVATRHVGLRQRMLIDPVFIQRQQHTRTINPDRDQWQLFLVTSTIE